MNKTITTKGGIKLKTAGTQVTEDIIVTPNLQSKSVTHNGSVVPDQGYCGLSEVTVDLPFITVASESDLPLDSPDGVIAIVGGE